ncbi:glycosyltransferase [Halomonas sp. N3-2A]|uniref:glycosyltransferase n=1 Tax=Halomonas sp. N3-2A TaxID=2014541 RepID=UPI000B5B2794|nr:glycosyltransferase [Halomonas sp. N3-2A]ASK18006.1 glycosyl transferase group 1 [Halomonas sp. N3-2A]
MDDLIKHAEQIASQPLTSVFQPIAKRVAYVVSHGQSYANNGYAIRTQGVAEALSQQGLEVLCFLRPGRPWEFHSASDMAPEVVVNGVKYIHSRWPYRVVPQGARANFNASVERFIELFRVYRPSVVLAASNWIVALPAWVAAKRLGLPFCNEVRGFWELSEDAREPGYAQTKRFKEEAERDSFVARKACQVFTLNDPMKAELVKRGVQSERIRIVPNGIRELPDLKSTDPQLQQRLGIQAADHVIGYIGSFNAYEGLDVLLQACEILVKKGVPLKLLLVGDDQPLTHVMSTHEQDADRPWLIQVGRVPHQQVADYYALIDCVAIPRKNYPVCRLVPPIKAAEALAYGKRLVMSKLPALQSACPVVKGVSFAEADNAELLAAALECSLEEPSPEVQKSGSLQVLNRDVLTFSRSTQGMAEALENVIQASVRQEKISQESIRQKPIELDKPALCSVQQSADAFAQVDYPTASRWFYKEGRLTDTLKALQNLQARGVKFDKPKRDFEAFVAGLARLKGGVTLPPRQPNAGLMSRRRRVLYCLHQSVPHATNGYSTRSHGIAVGLQESGWNVRATTRPGFPWDGGARGLTRGYHEATVDGVAYAACAGWNIAKAPLDFYLAEAADHYLREAQTSGAEIIVAASNHITALPALMAARRLGLPFVYEVRGLWEVTQASTQPEWAGSERYQLMRELEQQAALEADLVITLTEELADELVSWGVARERITVVPNAVNAERFTPRPADIDVARQLALPEGVPVIGYAGSAVAYEGLELLLEALAKLKARGQEFVFVLVGDGKVIDTVKATAKTLGIEKNCRFTGRVAFEQVPGYLSCMDIMPIPRLSSAVTEMVSALKPLEAMAMGKAVVLSDVSPHQVMAGPGGERARLFEKDNAAALCDALEALINNPAERERLGKAARTWIDRERTWNHVTSIYARSLQQLRESLASCQQAQEPEAKTLAQLTLGLIGDTFTTDTLASAVKVVPLSPNNWREQIKEQPIDALFVESAWKGNDWQWFRQVGHYSDHEFAALDALLAHCRRKGIPSLFWNKEDPVHFNRFRATAAKCDHVFTTDSRRIVPYLSTPGAFTQTASSAPFYASPKIHNLLPSSREWQPTAAYGGTYYGKRYPERTEYMDKIMSAAAPLGLTLYDRQHDDPASPYKYPGGLGSYVAGSLSYEEMIQAYKAHPVQINVNSVLDSPTMFSRRVVETAACGSPMISGPALGMNRYLEGAGHVVRTESDAAQALENLMHYSAYRWRVALQGARAVMRAHTTELRLTQMLRTAGMVIQAPEPPAYSIYTFEMTPASAQRVLAQTVRPACIVSREWQVGTRAQLEAEGIRCAAPDGERAAAGTLWLLANPRALEGLEAEDLEDLIWPTFYAPHKRIAFSRHTVLEEGGWPGVAVENSSIDTTLQLLRPDTEMALSQLQEWVSRKPTLALRKPPQVHAQPPNVPPKKTVVIAGHDLKFIKPFYPYFTKAGMRLLLDFWTGHNQHNETASKRLVRQADTVFCEWTLGNAIWYAKNKREGQKLVGRLHLQEIDHALFSKIPFEAFDTVMFVGPHILRQGVNKNAVLKKNGVVIYNGVDIEGLQSVKRKLTNNKVLGFVGIVPQRKRFDLALDILRELRKEDTGYTLRIKGKRPEEYPWMANRPEEMAWYEVQYRRLEEDPLLKGAVIFDPHGNDMAEWYAGINFALSTSDFESFHFTIADGAASGCTPIILPWDGADEIYPKEWVYSNPKIAAEGIKSGASPKESNVRFAKLNFDINVIARNMLNEF